MPDIKFIKLSYQNTEYLICAKIRRSGSNLLVFIHGWGCAKECFDEAFEIPEFKELSILTFDLLGHGQSDKPSQLSYDLKAQAKIAVKLIRAFKPGKVYLVGHSMGGTIGLLCAQDLKNDLVYFISAEGNLAPHDVSTSIRQIAKRSSKQFKVVGYRLFKRALETSDKQSYKTWANWLAYASPEALHKSAQSLVDVSDNADLLAAFRLLPSKKYIYGASNLKDPALGFLKNTEAIAIQGSGHFMMLENPSSFYQTIADLVISENLKHEL